jgi:phage I-like protein
MSILDQVKAQVQQLTPEQVRERLMAMETRQAKQREKQKERNASLTDEQKAKRAETHKAYRDKNPDKFKAQREAYNKKPEVVERRKVYMKKRNEEFKALRARAKELGIEIPKPAGTTTSSPVEQPSA